MSHHSLLPPDPFAEDPNDPAALFEPEAETAPTLNAMEYLGVLQELEKVDFLKSLLRKRGIVGFTYFCDDCDNEHYCTWEIYEDNLHSALAGQLAPVHEPSIEPDPNAYVPWDYCEGYLAGFRDAHGDTLDRSTETSE